MPGVELKVSEYDGHIVVALRGELDVTSAADAEAAITALMAPGQSLIIDMAALGFMDCASLGALLGVQTLARRGGGDVVLAAPQPHALRLLALTGTDEVLCVQASVAAAVAGITSAGRGIVGGGLRCALHALGGQRHRIPVGGDHGRDSGGPRGFPAQPDTSMTDSRTLAAWGQVAAHGRRVSVADICAVAVSSRSESFAAMRKGGAIMQSRRYRRAGDELPDTLRRSCQEAQDTFARAHDSAVQVYGEGDQADRAAFTSLKEKFEKRGDHWIAKRDLGD